MLPSLLLLLQVGCAPPAPAPVPEDTPPPSVRASLPEHPGLKVLRRAVSLDGLHWALVPGVLATGASSPCVAEVEGQLRVYFVARGEHVAWVPFDGGDPVDLVLDPPLPGIVVDPEIVRLGPADYRLYAIHQPELGDPASGVQNRVISARSTDGTRWTLEAGLRMEDAVVDPDVVALPDGWRMYLTGPPGRVRSARSDDGLVFAWEDGVRFDDGGVTSTIPGPPGFWTYYFSRSTVRAISADGLAFVRAPEGPILEPLHGRPQESPSVAVHGNRWWMAYAHAESPDDLLATQ